MQLRFHAPRLDLAGETRTAIERNLRLTLGRHAPAIAVAWVSLSAGADPAGGRAARCRIRLRRHDAPALTTAAEGADAQAAVALATHRLTRHLAPTASTRRLPGAGGMSPAVSTQRAGGLSS